MTDKVVAQPGSSSDATGGRGRLATFVARLLRSIPLILALVALSVALSNMRATRKALD